MSGRLLVLAMCAAEVAGMAGYAGFVAQLPQLSEAWRLSATQAGLIGGAFYAGYTLAVPVLVTLTDRTDPRRIYLFSMAMSGLAALAFAVLADGIWTASLAQLLMGVGLAGTYMPGLRLLSDRLEGQEQSRAVSLYTGSYALGTSLSFVFIGQVSQALGWRWAFGLAAIGPMLALVVVAALFRPAAGAPDRTMPALSAAFDFRPVLRDRAAMACSVAYAAHNFELFGLWSWAVAFLTFAYGLRPDDAFQIDPTLSAAALTLLLLPASVAGNEVAGRLGRPRWIIGVMLSSALFASVLGFAAGTLPSWALLSLILVYGAVIAAESGTLTSAVVAVADPRFRGMTMAVYSTVGFAGAFTGPLVFGAVLHLVGAVTVLAWGLAFAAMGLGVLVGPMALMLLGRSERSDPEATSQESLSRRPG